MFKQSRRQICCKSWRKTNDAWFYDCWFCYDIYSEARSESGSYIIYKIVLLRKFCTTGQHYPPQFLNLSYVHNQKLLLFINHLET